MSAPFLVLFPLFAGAVLGFGLVSRVARYLLLSALSSVAASVYLALEWAAGPETALHYDGRILLDPSSILFLLLVNVVYFTITVHVWSRARQVPSIRPLMPRFALLSSWLMATVNLLVLSQHLLFMWALLELSTLLAAPLVLQAQTANSRRAAWTYLLFSTVSLAVVLLGLLCLERSLDLRGVEAHLTLSELPGALADKGDVWQRLGVALVIFGLASKLGLAPVYGWLPETYDSAPPSVTALLAAVQANAVMLLLFRAVQLFQPKNGGLVSTELLVLGALSLFVATMNVIATDNYKRLIAYACISSTGVIAIGLSLGKNAAYGVVLYVVSNGFVKAILFLTAGKLKAAYKTKRIDELGGALKQLPYSGLIFTIGTFALLGFPPFGSFMAEMLILSGAVQTGHFGVFILFGGTLTIIFVATGRSLFPMIWGEPKRAPQAHRETILPFVPKLTVIAVLVILGVYPPEPVTALFLRVAESIGSR